MLKSEPLLEKSLLIKIMIWNRPFTRELSEKSVKIRLIKKTESASSDDSGLGFWLIKRAGGEGEEACIVGRIIPSHCTHLLVLLLLLGFLLSCSFSLARLGSHFRHLYCEEVDQSFNLKGSSWLYYYYCCCCCCHHVSLSASTAISCRWVSAHQTICTLYESGYINYI